MIGWLNDINRLVSKGKREHHESSQQKTASGPAPRPPAPPPATGTDPADLCPPKLVAFGSLRAWDADPRAPSDKGREAAMGLGGWKLPAPRAASQHLPVPPSPFSAPRTCKQPPQRPSYKPRPSLQNYLAVSF